MKEVIEITPQAFQYTLRKLHLLIVPAPQSMGAPVQQHLQCEKVKTHINMLLLNSLFQAIISQLSQNISLSIQNE